MDQVDIENTSPDRAQLYHESWMRVLATTQILPFWKAYLEHMRGFSIPNKTDERMMMQVFRTISLLEKMPIGTQWGCSQTEEGIFVVTDPEGEEVGRYETVTEALKAMSPKSA